MDIADIACRFLAEGDFEDGIITGSNDEIAFIDKDLVEVLAEMVSAGFDNLASVIAGCGIVILVVGGAHHLSIGVSVRAELVASRSESETSYHSPCHFFAGTLDSAFR